MTGTTPTTVFRTAAAAVLTFAFAAAATAAPKTWDIGGVHLGMAADAAQAEMRKRFGTVQSQVAPPHPIANACARIAGPGNATPCMDLAHKKHGDAIFTLRAGENDRGGRPEVELVVHTTGHGSNVVWKIEFVQHLPPGSDIQAYQRAIVDKYGPWDRLPGGWMTWESKADSQEDPYIRASIQTRGSGYVVFVTAEDQARLNRSMAENERLAQDLVRANAPALSPANPAQPTSRPRF